MKCVENSCCSDPLCGLWELLFFGSEHVCVRFEGDHLVLDSQQGVSSPEETFSALSIR